MTNTNGFDDFDTKVTAEEFYRSEGYDNDMIDEFVRQDITAEEFYRMDVQAIKASKQTVTFIDISAIYDQLELSNQEVEWIADVGLKNVSYGDAMFTLVGNVFALDCLLEGYEDYHKNNIANKSMTRDDFANKFWEVVDDNDYVNLEN